MLLSLMPMSLLNLADTFPSLSSENAVCFQAVEDVAVSVGLSCSKQCKEILE